MVTILDHATEEYESFVAEHPRGSLFQSFAWARVKIAWRMRAVVVRDASGKITGTCAVLLRRVPWTPFRMMYACRGPVCDEKDRRTLLELTEGLRRLAAEERAYVCRMDPDVSITDEAFHSGMKAMGWELRPESEGFETVQAQHVIRLRLEGKTEEQLLAGMTQKTRYNVRLAARKGVTVCRCGRERLPDFCALMEETARRDGFCARGGDYYARLLNTPQLGAALYMAFYEGRPLAGAIMTVHGKKADYLYGASSGIHREVMANYLLHWTMIREARDRGCEVYDFRGVPGTENPDHPQHGLLRFKGGWGGEKITLMGEYEMVFRPLFNRFMKRAVPAGRTLLLLRARLALPLSVQRLPALPKASA